MSANSQSSVLLTLLYRKRGTGPGKSQSSDPPSVSPQPLVCSYRFDGVSSRCKEILPLGSTKSSTWESRSRIISFRMVFTFLVLQVKFSSFLPVALCPYTIVLFQVVTGNGFYQSSFIAIPKICGITFEVFLRSLGRYQAQGYPQPV